jgi:hypothetical protein
MRSGVEFGLADDGGQISLFVRGAPTNADMSVVPSELASQVSVWQPTAGRFKTRDGVSRFQPRFPLVRGLTYSLLIDGVECASIAVPARTAMATTDVVSIHPTAAELPQNLLHVYVYFSAPMSEGYAASAVAVHRLDTGERLDDVFVQMEPELWDRSRQRLTLLLEPGRIKRGLVPNIEAGPPLIDGVPIAVRVDRSFRDAAGGPLREPAERRYLVGAAIRARVDPLSWRLTPPTAGSSDELLVSFDRAMDRALLGRCLTVVDPGAAAVPGEATVDEGEHGWRFRPEKPWRAGRYELLADTRLEDVAGNSVRRVFDRDLRLPANDPLDAEFVDVQFTVS